MVFYVDEYFMKRVWGFSASAGTLLVAADQRRFIMFTQCCPGSRGSACQSSGCWIGEKKQLGSVSCVMNLTYLPTSLTHSCIMFGGTRRSTVARTRLAKINIFWILLYYERTRRRVETWIGWVYVWTDNHTFLHNNVFGTVCSGPHFSSVQTTKSYLLVTYRLSMKLKLVETSFDFSVSNWTSALESLEGNDHQNVGQASPFQPKHG
jgi:hypothetical protein